MYYRQIFIHTSRRILELYDESHRLCTYSIAVGKPTTPTPQGHYTIVTKVMHPGGVFGSRWMGLSIPHYGIHGTNNPSSIGQAVSKGCIRMHNQDIDQLYQLVGLGTPVIIQN